MLRKLTRYAAVFVATAATVVAATTACSKEAAHRMLVFFYDGVPPLDARLPDAGAESGQAADGGDAVEPSAGAVAAPIMYLHPAYRESRCGGCHVAEGGGLLKTAREGLCLSCHEHTEKPPPTKHVHAPVAMRDCLACHTYHKSRYEKLLFADAQTVCYSCHPTEELITDKEHHETIDEKRCIDCHDAHGGDDPFFLLPEAKAQEPS